jgi:Fe-S cluster assembly protein SufD
VTVLDASPVRRDPRPDPRAEATAARTATLPAVQAAPWAQAARADARARLDAMGLPQRRDEYWRFTDPTSLNAPIPAPAQIRPDVDPAPFAEADPLRLVFVDGVPDREASDALALENVEVDLLSDAMRREDHWAAGLYGVLEAEGQRPVARPFAVLNTAAATEGVTIRATGAVARPILLIYRRSSDDTDVTLHHVVRVEPGATLTLLENGPAAARFSSVMEVEVGQGASFHHVRAQGRDQERRAVTHVFARLAAEAQFRSFTQTLNGALTRNEAVITFTGDDALAHVAGACVGDGAGFHHDDTVFVTHGALRCESRQVFKKVLRHGATGVFQGKILVKEGAQKTDGYQISQALLLDESSRFLAKPELEIYADDVACSHGSTAGAIDEAALFYLRSRGVPQREAQDLLTQAFLREALEEVADPVLAEDLARRLEDWLARRR